MSLAIQNDLPLARQDILDPFLHDIRATRSRRLTCLNINLFDRAGISDARDTTALCRRRPIQIDCELPSIIVR